MSGHPGDWDAIRATHGGDFRPRRYAWGGGSGRGKWHRDAGPWADDERVRRTRCGLRFAVPGMGQALAVDCRWPLCSGCQ